MSRDDDQGPVRGDAASRFWQLLQTELAPYPARWPLAARIAASCTITMAIEMVFRIPGAALGVFFVFLIPRESYPSTWRAIKLTVVACTLATVQLLAGAIFFAGSPVAHFFWSVASIFLVFYVISIVSVSSASTGFAWMTAGGIAIWDGMAPATNRVTLTLYLFLAILVGCTVTAAVEFIFSRIRHHDVVLDGIRVRVSLVRELLEGYVRHAQPSTLLQQHLRLYALQGTGHLRDVLASSDLTERRREQVSEALALADELVTIASATAAMPRNSSEDDVAHLQVLTERLRAIERSLLHSEAPARFELPAVSRTSHTFPALTHFELTIDLLADAFTEGDDPLLRKPREATGPWHGLWRSGDHARFVIRGGLSAMLCYLVYMSAGWRGLNASIITCFLTAVTSVGMTRQRQLLRLLGVVAGGCILGIGSQALLFPWIETLPEFAIVFGGCMFLCAWVATSSPRISFAGPQMGLAYVLVTLSGFGINTSLIPVRDTLLGILLGLAAMWLVYDHLWAVPSAKAHRQTIVAVLRRMAELARKPQSAQVEREREWALRSFEDLRALADARLFEPHPVNEPETREAARIERWQPLAGSLCLTFFSLLEHVEENGAQVRITASVLGQTADPL